MLLLCLGEILRGIIERFDLNTARAWRSTGIHALVRVPTHVARHGVVFVSTDFPKGHERHALQLIVFTTPLYTPCNLRPTRRHQLLSSCWCHQYGTPSMQNDLQNSWAGGVCSLLSHKHELGFVKVEAISACTGLPLHNKLALQCLYRNDRTWKCPLVDAGHLLPQRCEVCLVHTSSPISRYIF